jgi:hypothetical protein
MERVLKKGIPIYRKIYLSGDLKDSQLLRLAKILNLILEYHMRQMWD